MKNLTKAIVLDRRTDANLSLECGDLVMCCNCGKTMFVNIGTEICPECNEKTLEWTDENEEVSEDFFSNNKKYVLVDTEC